MAGVDAVKLLLDPKINVSVATVAMSSAQESTLSLKIEHSYLFVFSMGEEVWEGNLKLKMDDDVSFK